VEQITRTERQLGAALRRYRKSAGVSQSDLGARVGKRQATLSSLEGGMGGTLDTLFAILNALELEIIIRPRSKGKATRLGDIF
jgi:HTH-type transcriptional regulator/antitoxin HipB